MSDASEGTIIVIGATGAIGSALARRLVAAGNAVHLVARDASVAEMAASLPGATHAVADALDDAALTLAIAQAGDRIGGLAYCVGSIVLKPVARATVDDYMAAYRLNVVGAARAVAAAQNGLKAAGGAVVLFSSVAARSGFANHAIIGSAKAAVEGLTVALAAELAPAVRVNCVAPSLTRSKMSAGMTGNDAMAKAIAASHPIPRLGEPDDAAALAAFLLSPDSGWITGQVMAADGGRSTLRTKG